MTSRLFPGLPPHRPPLSSSFLLPLPTSAVLCTVRARRGAWEGGWVGASWSTQLCISFRRILYKPYRKYVPSSTIDVFLCLFASAGDAAPIRSGGVVYAIPIQPEPPCPPCQFDAQSGARAPDSASARRWCQQRVAMVRGCFHDPPGEKPKSSREPPSSAHLTLSAVPSFPLRAAARRSPRASAAQRVREEWFWFG